MRNYFPRNISVLSLVCIHYLTSNVIHGFLFPTKSRVALQLHPADVSLSSSKTIDKDLNDPNIYGKNQQQRRRQQQQLASSKLGHGGVVKSSMAFASSLALATLLALPLPQQGPAEAYDASDYASETVQAAVQSLRDARGNADQTFKAFENINTIITEGKGVGGMINYQGVELERGYIADEDTTIYNPGLTLLTESEKDRLVRAIIDSRKYELSQPNGGQWNDNNQFAFESLKERLDPYHMVELQGYLKIVPIYGAVLYLVVLAIQQLVRDIFPVAYIVGALAFFLPILGLVLAGP